MLETLVAVTTAVHDCG